MSRRRTFSRRCSKARRTLEGNQSDVDGEWLAENTEYDDFDALANALLTEETTLRDVGLSPTLRLHPPRGGHDGIKSRPSREANSESIQQSRLTTCRIDAITMTSKNDVSADRGHIAVVPTRIDGCWPPWRTRPRRTKQTRVPQLRTERQTRLQTSTRHPRGGRRDRCPEVRRGRHPLRCRRSRRRGQRWLRTGCSRHRRRRTRSRRRQSPRIRPGPQPADGDGRRLLRGRSRETRGCRR